MKNSRQGRELGGLQCRRRFLNVCVQNRLDGGNLGGSGMGLRRSRWVWELNRFNQQN